MTAIEIGSADEGTRRSTGRDSANGRAWSVLWTAGLLAILPLLVLYLRYIWQFEHYRYFPFLLLLCAVLVYQRWDRRLAAPDRFVGWGGLGIALVLLLIAGVLYSPWLGSVAFVTFAGSFLWSHRGVDGRRLAYLGIPLLLLIRLPLNYDQRLVVSLQSVTTQISSFLLDLMAVPHDAIGNIIQLPDRQLLVAEACSGVQSAFTLCFVALALAVWNRRSILLLPIAVCMALLWAVLANTLRVTTIAVAAYTAGVDLSTGWQHELLGYLVLAVAILLVFSTDRLLVFIFHDIVRNTEVESSNPLIRWWDAAFRTADDAPLEYADAGGRPEPAASPVAHESSDADRSAARRRPMLIAVVTLLFLLVSAIPLSMVIASSQVRQGRAKAGGLLLQPAEALLQDLQSPVTFQFDRRVRDGADPRLGTNADIWQAVHDDFRGDLVISQPYSEWHDLNVCYRLLNWQLLGAFHTRAPGGDDTTPSIAISRFHHPDGSYGYLLCGALMADGRIQEPPRLSLFAQLADRCQRVLGATNSGGTGRSDIAMLQLWITSHQPLSHDAFDDAIDAFAQARDRFSDAMSAPSDAANTHPRP